MNAPGMLDTIHALEPMPHQQHDVHPAVVPPRQVGIAKGEGAYYMPEIKETLGGSVCLNRQRHRARAHIFGGSKAKRTQACWVLLNTETPPTFMQSKVWERMLVCWSASQSGRSETLDG